MSTPNFEVALTKCYFCNKDNALIMNRILLPEPARKVKQMHGHIINMDPCPNCKKMMEMGIILICIDNEKSEKDWNKPPSHERFNEKSNWMPNPYRTGGWFVVRDEFAERVFDPETARYAIRNRFMFMEDEAARRLGLYEGKPTHDSETLEPIPRTEEQATETDNPEPANEA